MALTRRRLLASAGIGAAGVGLGAGGYLLGHDTAEAEATESTGTVPFDGEHQAGIATPVQDRLHFASFDLETESKTELRELMEAWSKAAREMTEGRMIGTYAGNRDEPAPPEDTGEAFGLPASNLTITFGFGPSIFDRSGLGLAAQRPAELKPLPALPGDELSALESNGDICVQACADDPQVVFHAVRDLARIGRGKVTMRWSQLGFGRTSTTSRSQETPRNLFGMKDGTANIKAEDTDAMEKYVWVADGPAWMRGGSYLVTRRIRQVLEVWDRSALQDQERTIGRRKYSGAPLGEEDEFDPLPLDEKGDDGAPVIPRNAHVRLASAQENGGVRILRRGYSFTDGVDQSLGELEAGLFFIAFQRDPEKQFVALQKKLGVHDALNEYIHHVGSALFAVPGGSRPGGYVGEVLLG
ncbi:MAG TPA: iron uptake transporter deferrochelatase/peroxidase subunit [Solirubrobacterales bacterium]|jgi:deferrochelatase/peroxidase EfeB|nr:iron uptake transporter deferrochelatase/peroxidase subunit [Solirubrobacterales bacterium]